MSKSKIKYDPAEFLFPSYDADGRSVRICVRIPASLNYAIENVMESRKFPFQIKDDLELWCLYKGLEALQSVEAECPRVMPLLKIMVIVFRAEVRLRNFEEFFIELDSVLLGLTKSPFRIQSARRLVKAVEEVVLCMPSGLDRAWFLRELRARWGHLLTTPVSSGTQAATDGCRG